MGKVQELKKQVLELHEELENEAKLRQGVLGAKIREIRKSCGMNQHKLASLTGISRPQLTNIELGTGCTRISTLIRLCDVLDTNPNTLLGYTEAK